MIPIENWGKDHWSTFAYVETLAVDNQGFAKPDLRRMRTNEKTHPHLVGRLLGNVGGSQYPTLVKEGAIEGHDDWDCLDELTKLGMQVAEQLRQHKMNGGQFRDFALKATAQ